MFARVLKISVLLAFFVKMIKNVQDCTSLVGEKKKEIDLSAPQRWKDCSIKLRYNLDLMLLCSLIKRTLI